MLPVPNSARALTDAAARSTTIGVRALPPLRPPHTLELRTGRELRHMIANLSTTVEEEEVDEILKDADPEGTGQCSYKEFCARMFKPV